MFRIMVVEDERELNSQVCQYLRQNGYEMTGCFDANEALNALYNDLYDLVISDIMMPGMDGFELASSIRKTNPEMPILFMTARDDFGSKRRGFQIGVDDYMVKPIDLEELVLRVGALLWRAKIAGSHQLTVGNVTMKEVAKMLHDACGCKQPLFYVPISMAYHLAKQMEKKAVKTGEKPMMTRFAVYNLDRNNQFDYSKAERELGYHTRPYAETLRNEARWLVAEGKIKGYVRVEAEQVPQKTVKEKLSNKAA